MDTKAVPYQPGAPYWGINCLVVFPTHYNPDNSLLILLQISLLFICTLALIYQLCKRMLIDISRNNNRYGQLNWCRVALGKDVLTSTASFATDEGVIPQTSRFLLLWNMSTVLNTLLHAMIDMARDVSPFPASFAESTSPLRDQRPNISVVSIA